MNRNSSQVIQRYEDMFREYLNISYAFSFWKGRVALYAILKALGIGEGDEVLVEGFTCIVVPNAVIYTGTRPIYVDIDKKSYNIDPNQIEDKITPKTKAIIVQHTFGLPADMEAILEIAQRHNLKVVEDCAPALGATYKGEKVGTLGDAAFFSSQWSKVISTGLGGMAVTNDPEIARKIEQVREEFLYPSLRERATLRLQLKLYDWMYNPALHWIGLRAYRALSRLGLFVGSSSSWELGNETKPGGYEKLFTASQASVGLKEFEKLDEYNKHRRYIAGLYNGYLTEAGLSPAYPDKAEGHIYLRYPLLVKNKETIMKAAQRHNIEIGDWFTSVLHPLAAPLKTAYYSEGDCPVGEEVARQIINLPTYPKIDNRKALRIIDFLKDHSLV